MDRTATAAAFALLCVSAAALPFELKRPIAALGPIGISSVEAVLYTAIGAWLGTAIARRRLRWTLTHTAVVVWIAATLLSAILAAENRAAAVKFALRSTGGCLLFLAAADLTTDRRRLRIVSIAIAAGAAIAALAAPAEIYSRAAQSFLSAFKTQPSLVGGFLRASGTFQYANTAAMYWEAALPVTVALAALAAGRGRRIWWIASTVVILEGIVLTASRAGLLVAALLLAALLAIGLLRSRVLATTAGAALGVLALLLALTPGSGNLLALRMRQIDQTTWYRASYRLAADALRLRTGDVVKVPVRVTNDGALTWIAGGPNPFHLSYHWSPAGTERIAIFEGLRTPLPRDVEPGGQVTLQAQVLAPARSGDYVLRWDMVQEGVLWFSTMGAPMGRLAVTVRGDIAPSGAKAAPTLMRIVPQTRPSRPVLWRAALRLWFERPVLGVGPDNFRHLHGRHVPGAGGADDRLTANSLYFETLANGGVVGMLALVWLGVAAGRLVWRSVAGRRTAPAHAAGTEAVLLKTGVALAVAAFFVHGLVDYFFEFTPTYAIFWLSLGALAGATRADFTDP
jgi:hypothetical protein